jgi:hypothetical protein
LTVNCADEEEQREQPDSCFLLGASAPGRASICSTRASIPSILASSRSTRSPSRVTFCRSSAVVRSSAVIDRLLAATSSRVYASPARRRPHVERNLGHRDTDVRASRRLAASA